MQENKIDENTLSLQTDFEEMLRPAEEADCGLKSVEFAEGWKIINTRWGFPISVRVEDLQDTH